MVQEGIMEFSIRKKHYSCQTFVKRDGFEPFGKKLSARLAICPHCILSICNIYLFPVLVLRAGFAF